MSSSLYKNKSILVVSAWLPEQEWLKKECIQQDLKQVHFLCCGVGVAEAVLAVTLFLKEHPSIDHIVFIGTAGIYDVARSVPSAVFSAEVEWCEPTTLMNLGYSVPKQNVLLCKESEEWGRAQIDLTIEKCVCTPSITLDADLADKLKSKGSVENLELFGVARVAEFFKIPWSSFLGISNTVSRNAHEQWKKHHLEASLKAQMMFYVYL